MVPVARVDRASHAHCTLDILYWLPQLLEQVGLLAVAEAVGR